MLKSYFLSAYRHLSKHRMFAVLNVFCLAIGITFSMLIGVYVIHERAFNDDLSDLHRQFVIKSNWKQEMMGFNNTTFAPFAKIAKQHYPNLIENYYRFITQNMLVSGNDNNFLKEEVVICDTTLVSIFGFPVLFGDANAAFQNNASAVVTESFALKYFRSKDVVGKVVHLNNSEGDGGDKMNFIISAVLKDMPINSVNDFSDAKRPYQIFIPMNYTMTSEQGFSSWANTGVPSMLKLKAGVRTADLRQPFKQTLKLNLPAVYQGKVELDLENLKDFYLNLNNGKVDKMTMILSYVAAFILILAIINFINIVLGTSGYRIKEIGLRKVFGGMRQQLVIQHLCESLLVSFASLILSFLFFELLRPVTASLLNTNLVHFWQFGGRELLLLLLLTIGASLLSGIYPGLVLSKYSISASVKGKSDSVNGGVFLRRAFLFIQFVITATVFIITLIISRQIDFILNKDLGFNKKGVIVLTSVPRFADTTHVYLTSAQAFRDEVARLPGIQAGSISYEIPDGNYVDNLSLIPIGADNNQSVSMPFLVTDENFDRTYGLRLMEGRFIKFEKSGSPMDEIVINQAALRAFGWKTGVGRQVRLANDPGLLTIVGVVNDFNFFSLKRKIAPLCFTNVSSMLRFKHVSFKFASTDVGGIVRSIQDKWRTYFPDQPFEFSFMDDNLAASYSSELQLRKAVTMATAMNLIIVFLGVFGILAAALAKRTREIAIRKIVGAGTGNIILLFIKEFSWLMLLANLTAWPAAYFVSSKWLENYAYHIEQNGIPYLIVLASVTVSALFLIAVQCYKVSSTNLSHILRNA